MGTEGEPGRHPAQEHTAVPSPPGPSLSRSANQALTHPTPRGPPRSDPQTTTLHVWTQHDCPAHRVRSVPALPLFCCVTGVT